MGTKCPQCLSENQDQSKFCAECGTKLPLSADSPFTRTLIAEPLSKAQAKGTVFAGKYTILGELGRGGMGVVYKAEDTKLKRTVALKFLPPALLRFPEARERFIREAQSAAALSHPNICTIHEVEEADDQPYIAMEFVNGEDLCQKAKRGPLAGDQAADIAAQIADGLEAAHQKGIIHRDIKSANIMVTEKGQAKIMDFGLAKVAGDSRLTKEARTIGTIAYMSPEQARGEDLDKRTDIWSSGVVLYEMLTGQLPFRGDRESIILHSITEAEPKPARLINPGIPVELQKIVDQALKKKREDRYSSAAEMGRDLRKYLESRRAEDAGFFNLRSLLKRLRNPLVAVPAALALLGAASMTFWFFNRQAKIRWATNEILPQISQLIDKEEYFGAFKLAQQAEGYIAKNPVFQEALAKTSASLPIVSTPPGASVYMKDYRAPESDWQNLGRTPIEEVRIPRGFLHWKIEKQGFATDEFAELTGNILNTPNKRLEDSLTEKNAVPEGMVQIPGHSADLYLMLGQVGPKIEDCWIDRYEVTNRAFKEFVDLGGYGKQDYWKEPFLKDEKTVSWEEAMKEFRDRTGQPGPSTWEMGTYPEGQSDYPVSGVSWYEAAAYAEFKGKTLPTIYHWDTALSPAGRIQFYIPLSNISGNGPAPVGRYQGMSLFGVYDMVGNVKEWCWNESHGLRYSLGGAWDDAAYMAVLPFVKSPFDRFPGNGFRCAKSVLPEKASPEARKPAPLSVRDYGREKPVTDQVFEVYRGLYAYDKTNLDPKIEARDESQESWIREKISFNAAYDNQRMTGYLFLPKKGAAPFEAVVYFPTAGAFYVSSSDNIGPGILDFLLVGGRAVFLPIYLSTFERRDGYELASVRNRTSSRDHFLKWSQDLGRSIDYLETRAEIDTNRLAYYGFSQGGIVGPVLMAVEPRLKVGILEAGGFLSGSLAPATVQAPEADPFNFAPRVKVPILMLNGRYDFARRVEEGQRLLWEHLGTPPEDKVRRIYETDHSAPRLERIKEVTAFLDKYFGPVKR